ncbi:MAG TPA: creatininase family protein [Ferrovibrio sp.]|uniref:creatininase family protein n=1 Tax=Ferrovibrio sp. TaxID=1917215 RepID=UPI002B4AD507|nr:creatininase family protein [Ferrovibrio sp.]HLT76637.1 creatininase family protein [Ferrovibrio sp.]
MTNAVKPRTGFRLADLTWMEAADLIGDDLPVVLPIGAAARAHGPHLPLGTDRLVVEAVAERLLAAMPVLVAPTIGQGYHPEVMDYPGSQHLEAGTFTALVTEIIEGYLRHGAERVLLLNNGPSTAAPLRLATQTILQRHGIQVVTADLALLGDSCGIDWADPEGGERDTSLLLAIIPGLVRLDRLSETAMPESDAADLQLHQPVRLTPEERPGAQLNRSGATGDATAATAEKGEKLLAAIVDEIVADMRALWPDLQP